MKTPIRELASTIKRLHGGTATHVETVPVKEEFNGKVICQGDEGQIGCATRMATIVEL